MVQQLYQGKKYPLRTAAVQHLYWDIPLLSRPLFKADITELLLSTLFPDMWPMRTKQVVTQGWGTYKIFPSWEKEMFSLYSGILKVNTYLIHLSWFSLKCTNSSPFLTNFQTHWKSFNYFQEKTLKFLNFISWKIKGGRGKCSAIFINVSTYKNQPI